jgi:hypothetical protein
VRLGRAIRVRAVRHRRLDHLDEGELTDEVRLSKSELGHLIQAARLSHGAFDRRVREAVIEADYRSAAANERPRTRADRAARRGKRRVAEMLVSR